MRIQLLSINFEPEQTGIAPYSTGLARHLSVDHDVTVITGVPHYPDWEVPEEYRRWRHDHVDGRLRVVRLRHYVPHRPGVARRFAYELSWAARAAAVGARIPTDVVIAVVPALLGAQAGRLVARRHRVPFGVVVQDVMGSAAAQSGVRGGGVVAHVTSSIERSALAAADSIATIHPRLATELARVAHNGSHPQVIYNWTHFAAGPRPDPALRLKHGWRDDEIVALHSGNMGAKQNLEVVIDAARRAEADGRNVRFVLAGGGSRHDALARYANGCGRLQFLDLVPDSEYMGLLGSADVLLVNERPGMREMSLPSKLTSYLAAGRPIVAATELTGATAEFICASGGGVVTPAGDAHKLLEAVVAVASDPGQSARMAQAGRSFAAVRLSHQAAMSSYDSWLAGLTENPAA